MFRRIVCTAALLATPAAHALTLGVLATESPEETKAAWQPLAQAMSKALGEPVDLLVTSQHDELLGAMRDNRVQLARVGNQLGLLLVEQAQGEVVVRVQQRGKRDTYQSVLLVPKSSPVDGLPALLKDPARYRLAMGRNSSTSGYLIPTYHAFLKNNVLYGKAFRSVQQGSHEDNFLAVARHKVDVATSNSDDLARLTTRFPAEAAQLKVIWTSPEFAFDPMVVRKDLPAEEKDTLVRFLTSLSDSPSGRAALAPLTQAQAVAGFKASGNRQLKEVAQLQLQRDLFLLQLDPAVSEKEKSKREKAIFRRHDQLVKLLGGAR
ncbi:phosphate/phosphite/phosphonate ABC transporter substrate-binding protein [Chitinibacteraceae bacterium HSL-7]